MAPVDGAHPKSPNSWIVGNPVVTFGGTIHLGIKSANRELSEEHIAGWSDAAYVASSDRFRFAACLSRFTPSRARRLAVRTSAAARDVFFACADRCSGVMFLADALPPCRPNMRAISVMAARTSGGIFMPSMVHLTGYGEDCGYGRERFDSEPATARSPDRRQQPQPTAGGATQPP